MQAVGGQTRARAARPENGIASSQPDAALRCRSYEHPAHAQVTGRTHAAAGNCETFAVQCIVFQRDTRQGKPQPQHCAQHERTLALHHRGRIRRSGGGQPTLQPTGSLLSRTQNVWWLVMHWVASSQALGCNAQDATASFPTRDPRSTHCLTCADPSTSARAATRKSPPCWQTSALPSARPGDTAAAIQRT